MATSKGANTYNRQNWENAEFPILCQTCLGDNPYVRMTRETYGRECKICARPFTVFRWCPGARMRFKKTEVCQTCSKLKNVCQTCLLDLEYGLPVQVRDHALGMKDDVPKSDVNKEYYTQNVEKELANSDGTTPGGTLGKANAPSDLLLKLARTTPYYKRNRPHICSFWVKGECKRGDECPYRHDMPTDPNDPLADQNIKDRYYGMSDPVATRLLKQASSMPSLEPPSDKSITTLYVGGLEGKVEESDLRDYFYQFGELRSITMVPRQNCAFVCFTARASAETAAERSFNKLILKGRRLKIMWGKSQGQQPAPGKQGGSSLAPVPGLPGALPPPPTDEKSQANFFNLPPSSAPPAGPLSAIPPPYLLLLGGFQACLLLRWGTLYPHHQLATHPLLHLVIHLSDHLPYLFMGHHPHLTCLLLLDMVCHAFHLVLHQYTIHLRILIVWVQGKVGKEVLVHQPQQLRALRLLVKKV
ncbi:unnamed protein product [Pocillopora meandrina]|uniref:Pre-mRNA-splicing factor RBM22 n=1 Tax=Pocillopora meandrina TaxID=46732 RepID=A0AAU9WM88_9CNID|nr:unnamed protein product [Pocillopora meandrina]